MADGVKGQAKEALEGAARLARRGSAIVSEVASSASETVSKSVPPLVEKASEYAGDATEAAKSLGGRVARGAAAAGEAVAETSVSLVSSARQSLGSLSVPGFLLPSWHSAHSFLVALHTDRIQPLVEGSLALAVRAGGQAHRLWGALGEWASSHYEILSREMSEMAIDKMLQQREVQTAICATAGGMLFMILLRRHQKDEAGSGALPPSAPSSVPQRATVSIQSAQASTVSAFAALKRAGVRSGDCVVALVGPLEACELTVWCRAYNSPLLVACPRSAAASQVKALLADMRPRVLFFDWCCAKAVADARAAAGGEAGGACLFVRVPSARGDAPPTVRGASDEVTYQDFLQGRFSQVSLPYDSPSKSATPASQAPRGGSMDVALGSPAADIGNMMNDFASGIGKGLGGLFGSPNRKEQQNPQVLGGSVVV